MEMGLPPAQGLYDPRNEHDACGVGFIANSSGKKEQRIVQFAIEALNSLAHRGALDADAKTGDGAGIHVQIPQDFFQRKIKGAVRTDQRIAVGMVFLPRASFQQQEFVMPIQTALVSLWPMEIKIQ